MSYIVRKTWHEKIGPEYLYNNSSPFEWGKSKAKAYKFASKKEADDFIELYWPISRRQTYTEGEFVILRGENDGGNGPESNEDAVQQQVQSEVGNTGDPAPSKKRGRRSKN